MKTQKEQIEEHRAQIPKLYQAIYKKAMTGKSRKAAMHSFCLQCCGWVIKEVFLCTSPQCELFPYRPKSSVPPDAPESVSNEQKSKNSGKGDNCAG